MRYAWRRAQRLLVHADSTLFRFAPVAGLISFQGRGADCRCDDKALVKTLREENAQLREQLRQLEVERSKVVTPPPIYRIVITGGPCGGKTTAMSILKERLEIAGWRVYIVPEAATMLFHNGARFHDFLKLGEEGLVNFQVQLAQLQMRLESTMHEMAAATGEQSVILCDRGTLDGKAYCTPQVWSFVLNTLGQSEAHLRDRRYDAVIHLCSAAKGAEKFYTLEQDNSTVSSRTETVEEARALDSRTIQAWVGHEHFYIIDNGASFSRKMERAMDRVLQAIGEPVAGHQLRKIRLPFTPAEEIVEQAKRAGVVDCSVFKCATTYIARNKRIRLRSELNGRGASFYMQTYDGSKLTKEARLDNRAYMRWLQEAHKAGHNTVEKQLVCFHWDHHVYEVNVFRWPEEVCILEVEAESMDAPIHIPPFLSQGGAGIKEVTLDERYDTRAIAERTK